MYVMKLERVKTLSEGNGRLREACKGSFAFKTNGGGGEVNCRILQGTGIWAGSRADGPSVYSGE